MSLSFIKVLDSTRIWLILSYRIIPCYSQQWAGSLHLFAFLATSGGSQGGKKASAAPNGAALAFFPPCAAPRRRVISEGGQRDILMALSPLQSATTPSYLRRGPEGHFDGSFSLAKRHDAALSQKGARGTF